MCMMLYIASDKVLPTIPWNNEYPDFYITDLKETDIEFTGVRKQVTKPYLYYVGAHTGCGCGFAYGMYEVLDESDIEENKLNRHSVEQLFLYIRRNLGSGEELQLYSCWAGNEGNSYEKKSIVDLGAFTLGDSFCFGENEIIIAREE